MKQKERSNIIKIKSYLNNSPNGIYSLVRLLTYPFDIMKVRIDRLNRKKMVLVYQQGRVASTSIHESLSELNENLSIYHVHTVSEEKADAMIKRAKRNGQRVNRYLLIGKLISRELERKKQKKWNVISVVRDPISMMISILFMDPELNFKDIIDKDEEVESKITEKIQKILETDDSEKWDICSWFDRVFNNELNIDIFNSDFDKEKGYIIYKERNINTLILRFEDMNSIFGDAVNKWLGINSDQKVELKYHNIYKSNDFSAVQDYVKKNLIVSEQACRRIYSTKMVQSFYSDEIISDLISKWTGKRKLIDLNKVKIH